MTLPFADIAVDADLPAEGEPHEIRMRRLAFALAYPFPHPARSYVYLGDFGAASLPADPSSWTDAADGLATERRAMAALAGFDFTNATAVLAAGSNAAPLQLTRKYAIHDDHAASIVIPCLRVRIPDHVACYSRHLAPYGSVPTMIAPYKGAVSTFYVNILDPRMLERLNHTEGLGTHYGLTKFGTIENSGYAPIDGMTVHGYEGLAGHLPFRLDTIDAEGCDLPALDQRGIQSRLIAALDLDISVERFVLRNIYEPGHRAEIVAELRKLQF